MPDGKLAAGSRTSGPVLLVEDDADIRSAMAELLQDEGYDFVLAEHGLDALEVLDRQTPSLLLTDLLMPVMNGVELIARLRDQPRWADLPVVVMTGAGDRIIGVELESLNLPVLKKPVDVADLAQMLARYSGAKSSTTSEIVDARGV